MDIAGFLRRYPPFDELTPRRLAEVARSVEIEHFPAGAVILQQGGEPASALYVVRKGAVELLDDGQVLDLLLEGEVFGQFSLLAHDVPSLTVRAHEDTLCYLLCRSRPRTRCSRPDAGLSFVIGSMRRRIARPPMRLPTCPTPAHAGGRPGASGAGHRRPDRDDRRGCRAHGRGAGLLAARADARTAGAS